MTWETAGATAWDGDGETLHIPARPPTAGYGAGWEQGKGTSAGTLPCVTPSIPARPGRCQAQVGAQQGCTVGGWELVPSLPWGSAGLGVVGLPGLIYNNN